MSTHRKDIKKLTKAVEALGPGSAGHDSDRPLKAENKQPRIPLGLWLARKVYVSQGKSNEARDVRRSFPIHGYCGPNGGGKSLCMIADTVKSLESGRTVLSTVRLKNPATGEDYPNYVKFENWDQLLDLRDADVLMDEIVGIANSRSASSLDVRVQNILQQLRRRNVVLRWSAPNWRRADIIIREVSQAVTECRGSYPDKRLVRAGENDAIQLWAPKRFFVWKTYDTKEFTDWTEGKRDKLDPEKVERFYGPGSSLFDTYDTLDAVSIVAGITEQGLCNICAKRMRVEYCKGHTEAEIAAHHVHFEDLGPADQPVGRASEILSLADASF